jgi:hypothetical protein
VPQKLLTIYRTDGAPITVSAVSGGFAFDPQPEGKVDRIFRVDFFDQPPHGQVQQTLAVVPCDPSPGRSTIQLDEVFIQLGLRFVYVLGVPNVDDEDLGLVGTLNADGHSQVYFQAPLSLDTISVLPNAVPGTPSSYSGSFNFLNNAGAVHRAIVQAALPGGALGWENFALGDRLFYHIRSLAAGPVLTMERTIPAVMDATGIRRLPAPFSILIDHPANPHFDQSKLLAIQIPNTPDFNNQAKPATDWLVHIGDFNRGTVADFWQRYVFERYVGALESVESGEPVSLLPRFTPLNSGEPPTAADGNWLLQLPAAAPPSQAIQVPSGQGWLTLAGTSNPNQVAMSCDAFRTWDGPGMQFPATIVSSRTTFTPPYMEFSAATVAGAAVPGPIRIGSLDLISGAAPDSFTCGVRFEPSGFGDFWVPRIDELQGRMLLNDAQPGGQDEPADPVAAAATEAVAATPEGGSKFLDCFKRTDPFVIPVIPLGSSSKSAFTLTWKETSAKTVNQSLTLTLIAPSSGGAPSDVLVIDPQPFTVARVQLPGLASAASAATSEVAQWSNSFTEGPGWRIAAGSGKFQMLLPPQGVGEEMVKGHFKDDNVPRPMQFRLTPTAVAGLRSDTQLQRYAEPGWNLRRVLGYPGERAPGAGLQNLSFEMLYGMTCDVTTPGLRMSEMFSRLGAFAGPLLDSTTGQLILNSGSSYTQGQIDQFVKLNQNWADIHAQLLSRLGVLELWADETEHELLLSSGVTYSLRNTAQLAYPVGIQNKNSNAPKQPADGGLPGGVAWPFDSANIYEDLWSNPNSTAAVLANPRFTALGGSGKQRASFSNGNIIIESETAIGTLVSVTVILRGYIGNLRHPAKHIVVYTRSVRPSRQFYGEQPMLEGRPILRKTAEYVDITQRDRSYPENGSPNATTGPLLGAEFKTIRINVDSVWGSDLGKGWRVPLWRRNATPPDVYPRPQVLLELAIDPTKGAASRTCEMRDPEKLYFYTDPNQTIPNTDEWPLVEFVDFCNNNRSRSIDPKNAAPDYTREPGFGQFTYTVDGDAPEINVVAQRTKNAMSSRLTNVMFMRGQPQPVLPNDCQAAAGRLPDHVQNILDELVRAAKIANQSSVSLKQALQDRYAKLNDIVTNYGADLTAIQNLSGNPLCGNLANSAANLVDRAAKALSAEWNILPNTLSTSFQDFTNPLAKFPEVLKQILLIRVDVFYSGLQSALSPLIADVSVAATLATSPDHRAGQHQRGRDSQPSGALAPAEGAAPHHGFDCGRAARPGQDGMRTASGTG